MTYSRPATIALIYWALTLTIGLTPAAHGQNGEVAATSQGATSEGVFDNFTLGPGDIIRVFVWKHSSLSTDVSISPDGKIRYPLVDEFHAAGLTTEEVETEITHGLSQHLQDPLITATLHEVRSYNVYVIGEVSKPGHFVMRGPITVLQAIASAGGFTQFATREAIVVNSLTSGAERRQFNYKEFVAGEDVESNIVLKPNDTVIVR